MNISALLSINSKYDFDPHNEQWSFPCMAHGDWPLYCEARVQSRVETACCLVNKIISRVYI
jgi:hypothetical protein